MNQYVVTAVAVSVSLFSSLAFANSEPLSQIVSQNSQKKQVLQFLGERLNRHQKMSVEEIKADLIASLQTNHEALRNKGELSSKAIQVLALVESKINSFESKDEILKFEKNSQKEFVSAYNTMFGLTNLVYKDNSTTPLFLFITLPLDILCLPITFVISMLTGF